MDAVVTSATGEGHAVRVLLVDDEALMRAGLRLMIDGTHGIEVVGEAADGQAALDQVRALAPDVVLMDIRMPRMTGLEALRALRAEDSPARVVMLTAFDTDDFLLAALRAGAVSFLLKDSPPEDVVQAVLDAAAERPRFSPEVLRRLVRLAGGGAGDADVRDAVGGVAGGRRATGCGGGAIGPLGARSTGAGAAPDAPPSAAAPSPSSTPAPPGITDREWEVALLVARGLSNQEVGERLFMSIATVKTHLGRLYHKLQATNRVQLAIRVLELGG